MIRLGVLRLLLLLLEANTVGSVRILWRSDAYSEEEERGSADTVARAPEGEQAWSGSHYVPALQPRTLYCRLRFSSVGIIWFGKTLRLRGTTGSNTPPEESVHAHLPSGAKTPTARVRAATRGRQQKRTEMYIYREPKIKISPYPAGACSWRHSAVGAYGGWTCG